MSASGDLQKMIFHVLKPGYNDEYKDFVRLSPNRAKAFPECPRCHCRIGPWEWLRPFRVKTTKSRCFGDLFTDKMVLTVSQGFREAAVAAQLKGLSFWDDHLEVYRSGSALFSQAPTYHVVHRNYSFTRIDPSGSGLVVQELVGCEHCNVMTRARVERLVIDELTWNGDDIFWPTGLYGACVVTSRFVEVVAQGSFANFTFIHQDEYVEDWQQGFFGSRSELNGK